MTTATASPARSATVASSGTKTSETIGAATAALSSVHSDGLSRSR